MTYLFPLATADSTVNGWAVCRVTNPLQDCCFPRICSSYDEDSEYDVWNRAGLFRIHCFCIDCSYRLESDRVRNRFKESISAQVHTLIKQYVPFTNFTHLGIFSRYQPNDKEVLDRTHG